MTITTELSSCDAENFTFSTPDHLPTSHIAGHQQHTTWHISRVGILGTGAEKMRLDILFGDGEAELMTLTGTLEQTWLHSESSRPFTSEGCDIRRLIILSGQLEDFGLTGVIRTTLASGPQSAACALPAPFICEVAETFSAAPYPPE